MRITDRQIEHYREHGYVIVENFLEPGELARARDEIEAYIPGWLGYAANPRGAKPEGWDKPARSRRTTRFPFPGTQLNAITLHPELWRFVPNVTTAMKFAGHPSIPRKNVHRFTKMK